MYKLTKEQLVARCKRLESENERLTDELEKLSDCYSELENQLVDATDTLEDTIKDLDEFKYRLQLDGLLTPQLESFIEHYLKYYNEIRG